MACKAATGAGRFCKYLKCPREFRHNGGLLKQEKKISLRLDIDLAERLQERADDDRVPVSFILRHLVLRFLSGPFHGEAAASPALPGVASPLRGGVPAPSVIERKQVEFRQEVCALFDMFRGQGHDAIEATKRSNFALKARKHPWASYDVIAKVLRSEGRFRKSRRVR
jgi:hypothetical protein